MDNQHEQSTVSGLTPEQREIRELKQRIEQLEQKVAQLDGMEDRVVKHVLASLRDAVRRAATR